MNKGRQRAFAAIVQTHFDEALAADPKGESRTRSTVKLDGATSVLGTDHHMTRYNAR
jgi:hypothetical protein